MQRQQPKVSDDHLIRREIYNPNNFDIEFRLDALKVRYIVDSGISPGSGVVVCKAKEFCLLNHAYYVPYTKSGEGGTYLTNFGDDIGRGNTKPSAPFVRRARR